MGRMSDTISCPLDSELVQLGTSHFKEDTQIVSKNFGTSNFSSALTPIREIEKGKDKLHL
jgi:hypothetical protein